ncbi:MAG: hypothetical protein ACI4DP_01820 [Candidatus Ornithomonoglobus sp.]
MMEGMIVNMYDQITQGTVITSIRSVKYSGINCFGIVISARCDLANDKLQKVFYLAAIDFGEWILSKSGFKSVSRSSLNNISSSLKDTMERNGLDWDTIKSFSLCEFNTVIDSEIHKKKDDIKKKFEKYKKYSDNNISFDERKDFLRENKKDVINFVTNVVNGQNSHYVYIPSEAISMEIKDGLMIDLQELDYFNIDEIRALNNCSIDVENKDLTNEQKTEYNKKFFIYDSPGYSIPLCDIKSPWIEYLMQHFSNLFARIGVHNPSKENVEEIINRILDKGVLEK